MLPTLFAEGAYTIAWFAIGIWMTVTITEATYFPVLFFLAIRSGTVIALCAFVHVAKPHRMAWFITMMYPLIFSIVLTVYCFNQLDRSLAFLCWQALVGLAISGTILSAISVLGTIYLMQGGGKVKVHDSSMPALVHMFKQ